MFLVHGCRERIDQEKFMRNTHLSRYLSEADSVLKSPLVDELREGHKEQGDLVYEEFFK